MTLLTLNKITPVIDAVFGRQNLQSLDCGCYRLSIKSPVNWDDIKLKLHNIICTLNLKPLPLTSFVADYFDGLVPQMLSQQNFNQRQISYLLDAIFMMYNSPYATLEGLFKIALAFEDGHELRVLKDEMTNVYLTREISLILDVPGLFEFATNFGQALQTNNINLATQMMSEYILTNFFRLSSLQLKEQLIAQVSKKLPAIYEAIEEAKAFEEPLF